MAKSFASRSILVYALALSLAACSEDRQPREVGSAPPPAVTVVRVVRQDLTARSSFTGRVEAVDRVELLARVPGFIEQRLFEEGAKVQTGDRLFVIEKAPYQAAVADAQGAIQSAEGALKLADAEVDRFQALVEKKAVSQNDLDQRIAQQTAARGALMQTRAALQKAELELGYTEIQAPVSGRIGRAAFSPGSYVGPGSGPLATLVSEDPMYVVFPVSQRHLLELRSRQQALGADPWAVQVRLRLADGTLYPHAGRVDFVDVRVDPGTDTVTVRAEVPNPEGVLRHAALVTAVIESARPEQALLLPLQGLQVDQGGRYVLVVDAENRVAVRRITTGPAVDGMVPVESGLNEGEPVLVEGVQKVRPGMLVAPTEAPAPVQGKLP